tara:strand:+ start:3201 stop:3422 length:222 start_codon:yes stop_codon:yes gene_type:complete
MTDIDTVARKTAVNLAHLMSMVEYDYNRDEPCLVCKQKYKHHIDGLACESDDNPKQIIRFTTSSTNKKIKLKP